MERVIHTRVVFDMDTLETLEDESYRYEGPVAECGGGGGGSEVNSVDYGYNDRMATIAEEQQAWARDYYKLWSEYYRPYEIAQVQANMQTLPLETSLYTSQLRTANSLLPAQQEAAQKFYNASAVDVNERMGLATADVANAWKDVQATTERNAARLGVNPNSGRFAGIMAGLDTEKASQLAGARTQARVQAEAENYERLKNAAGLNATGGLLQGIGLLRG